MSTKTARVIMWICIAGLTLQFLGAGVTKMAGAWAPRFSAWGYPPGLAYVTGALEVIGVAGLFFLKTRKWSAVIFVLIMIGAAWTHVVNSEFGRVVHNGVVMGVSLLVMYLDRRARIH